MENIIQALIFAMAACFSFMLWRVLYSCWVLPIRAYRKLASNGFSGPPPSFPLGNIVEMKKTMKIRSCSSSSTVSNDIHSSVFPFFSQWQKSYGKVFMYWLGTKPFLYIADPEFLKTISSGVMGKSWGKPNVFKNDRKPMFGDGLVMVEGDDWVRHRHVITPAFSPSNLKAMSSMMVETTRSMLDRWADLINNGKPEIEIEREIISTAGEIIAKTSFGMNYENGRTVFKKLRAMQETLFKSSRYVGVPFGKYMCLGQNLEAERLGKEIDALLMSIIVDRKRSMAENGGVQEQQNLLGVLLAENHVDGKKGRKLSTRELVDECKTFFFGGHETTALAITWSLLLLAEHPMWQDELREEIIQVIGDGDIDATTVARLKKMGWVMNEVLRLYPTAPNVQRQVRGGIRVDQDSVIPDGTNIWIDVVAMHHDREFWGEDVNEFNPGRFKDDLYGGCQNKMGYLPFGFGGRMCVGRNLSAMEYKIVLSLILTRFSFSLSPNYTHLPAVMLSLRPMQGLPLIMKPL
ncbi:cytokinin hydroxylase-like [Bidens hawaiensis]|uniref:cytokinin hydroxylase-like n=1 Tax=Bidens hawaiensis TaxID=980011 RepID=UPI0040491A8C